MERHPQSFARFWGKMTSPKSDAKNTVTQPLSSPSTEDKASAWNSLNYHSSSRFQGLSAAMQQAIQCVYCGVGSGPHFPTCPLYPTQAPKEQPATTSTEEAELRAPDYRSLIIADIEKQLRNLNESLQALKALHEKA